MADQALIEDILKQINSVVKKDWSWPPGQLGVMTQYIWDQSLYPTADVSVVTPVFIIASQLGRHYNVDGMGLNLYLTLLAPLSSGKNFAGDGLSNIYKLLQAKFTNPAYRVRVGPGNIPSAQGLIQHIVGSKQQNINPCLSCGSYLGEYGYKFKRLFTAKNDPMSENILAALLELYTASGSNRPINPTTYSKSKDNVDGCIAPCFSILSDSTPDVFYKTITPETINSGLIPRFQVFEFQGSEEKNPHFLRATPPDTLINWLAGEIKAAIEYESRFDQGDTNHLQWRNIRRDEQTELEHWAMADRFRRAVVNPADDQELIAAMISRVPQKVAKVAAIAAIATARPGIDPLITHNEQEWALEFVLRGTWPMIRKHIEGKLGPQSDNTECYRAMDSQLNKYLELTANGFTTQVMQKAKMPPNMIAVRCIDEPSCGIPVLHQYLQQHLHNRPCFANNRSGAHALSNTLKEFIDAGRLEEIPSTPKNTDPNDPRYQWIKDLRAYYTGKMYWIKRDKL